MLAFPLWDVGSIGLVWWLKVSLLGWSVGPCSAGSGVWFAADGSGLDPSLAVYSWSGWSVPVVMAELPWVVCGGDVLLDHPRDGLYLRSVGPVFPLLTAPLGHVPAGLAPGHGPALSGGFSPPTHASGRAPCPTGQASDRGDTVVADTPHAPLLPTEVVAAGSGKNKPGPVVVSKRRLRELSVGSVVFFVSFSAELSVSACSSRLDRW